MVVKQGDVFWIDLCDPSGSAPGYSHPHVVVQNNVFNRSRINTVVVCALTSNLKRSAAPGNVLLKAREAKLPKASVVNVSQIFTVDKSRPSEEDWDSSARRVRQILDGMSLVLEPREPNNS